MSDPILSVIAPATSYDLTTLEAVRVGLGVTDNSEDDALARLISQASGRISEYCNRVFAQETVSDTFYLTRRVDELRLNRYPAAISSIVENGETLVSTAWVARESGLIGRLSNDVPTCWPLGKIVVNYVSGYALDDVPDDIQRATIMLVNQYRYSGSRDPQIRSESVEGIGSSSYFDGADDGGLAPEVRGILDDHCKPAGC